MPSSRFVSADSASSLPTIARCSASDFGIANLIVARRVSASLGPCAGRGLLGSSVQILRKFLYLTVSFLYWTGSDKVKYVLETLFPRVDSFREQCGPLRPSHILGDICFKTKQSNATKQVEHSRAHRHPAGVVLFPLDRSRPQSRPRVLDQRGRARQTSQRYSSRLLV